MVTTEEVISHVRGVARRLTVTLDHPLCGVCLRRRKPCVVVTIRDVPHTEVERSLLVSAFMCEVLAKFPDATVQVHVPRPRTTPVVPSRPTDLLTDDASGVRAWMAQANLAMAEGFICRVVSSYPWKNKVAMEKIQTRIVAELRNGAAQMLHPDAAVVHVVELVDRHLLPPLDSLVGGYDQMLVLGDVIRHDGGVQPTSVLRVYECVHDMIRTGSVPVDERGRIIRKVYDAVFHELC